MASHTSSSSTPSSSSQLLLHIMLSMPHQLLNLVDGMLPCTIICLAPASRSSTTAMILANALMASDSLDCFTIPEPDGDMGASFSYGSHILCFGDANQVTGESIHEVGKQCGLQIESIQTTSLESLDERTVQLVTDRIIQRHFFEQGWSRVFDDLYCYNLLSDKGGARNQPSFVDCVKVVSCIDCSRTDPFGSQANLALTISFEPAVYKRVDVNWDEVKSLFKQKTIDQWGSELGSDIFDKREELRVHVFPSMISSAMIITPSTDQLQVTALVKANQRCGYDEWIPTDEESMRRYWELAYMIQLPPGPLQYTQICFPISKLSLSYPASCVFKNFVHNYSRSNANYHQLCKKAFQVLSTLPHIRSFSPNAALTANLAAADENRVDDSSNDSIITAKVGKVATTSDPMSRDIFKTAMQVKQQGLLQFQPASAAVVIKVTGAGSISQQQQGSSSGSSSRNTKQKDQEKEMVATPQKKAADQGQQSSSSSFFVNAATGLNASATTTTAGAPGEKRPKKKPAPSSSTTATAASVISPLDLNEGEGEGEAAQSPAAAASRSTSTSSSSQQQEKKHQEKASRKTTTTTTTKKKKTTEASVLATPASAASKKKATTPTAPVVVGNKEGGGAAAKQQDPKKNKKTTMTTKSKNKTSDLTTTPTTTTTTSTAAALMMEEEEDDPFAITFPLKPLTSTTTTTATVGQSKKRSVGAGKKNATNALATGSAAAGPFKKKKEVA